MTFYKMKHAEYKAILQTDFAFVGFLYKVSTKTFYI